MLTRLADRIEMNEKNEEVIVKRFGMWGTTAEVESCKDGYVVIHPNGERLKLKRLIDAEAYMKGLVSGVKPV